MILSGTIEGSSVRRWPGPVARRPRAHFRLLRAAVPARHRWFCGRSPKRRPICRPRLPATGKKPVARTSLLVATLLLSAGPSFAADPAHWLDAVVRVRAEIPPEARTASFLGTKRQGSGVLIDDAGLIVTIGYLITEAMAAEVTTTSGKVSRAAHQRRRRPSPFLDARRDGGDLSIGVGPCVFGVRDQPIDRSTLSGPCPLGHGL
jgi:S1-C subfamily serine protease